MLKDAVQKNKYMIAAIMLPMAVLAIAFFAVGIYPFGSNNLINSDLYAQFLPIMMEFKRAIESGGSIFYTFNGGLGTNFYALNAYQNASPLTWLFLALFGEEQMPLCATLLFMVKTGLASGAMYHYLSRGYDSKCELNTDLKKASEPDRRNDFSNQFPMVALSAVYSLCGYVVAFYFNLMWLECVMLLPLIVLGMRRAVEHRGNKLYIISLALMLFSSYYIGLMVLFFILAYFFIYLFAERKKEFLRSSARFILLTSFAVMLAMVVLLPTYHALTRTGNYETMGEESAKLFYFSLSVHLMQLLPGSKITILNGPPNIYSGLITIMLCLVYVFNGGIDLRKRVVKISFAVFVLFSTNFMPIDVIWQLGHPPNGFPSRYSFVLTFLCIEIAAESVRSLSTLDKKRTIFAVLGILAIYGIVLIGEGYPGIDKRFVLILGIAFTALTAYALIIMNKRDAGMCSLLLTAVIVLELITNTTYSIGAGGVVSSDRFLYRNDEVQELIGAALADNPHARMEVLGTDNYNAPFLYGYRGTSIFASSVPGDTFRLLNSLWFDPNGSGRNFTYSRMNPVADSMADIDYYISLDGELDIPWADEFARTENCYLYKSKYPTSIGYMVPMSMAGFDFSGTRPEILKEFVTMTSGVDDVIGNDGMDLGKWSEAYPAVYDELMLVDEMQGNRVTGSIEAGEDGILMTSIPYDDGWTVRVDGEEIENANSIRYLVSFPIEKGSHKIEMTYVPPKFKISAMISIASLMAFICAIIIKSGRKRI